jgi:uroporphyrinogen III methyltransferase/synthase
VVRSRDLLRWYERRPLFARRVLVLRSVEQRGGLLLELARAGAEARAVPLLEFDASEREAELRAALSRAAEYDWLVFSSANAVRFSKSALPETRPGGPPRVACIGAGSAAAARDAGLRVDVVPPAPFAPERLVAAMGSMAGQRVLLPRSAEARDTLQALLEGAGAQVTAIEAYRNVLPAAAREALCAEVDSGVDAALLTSPSTVERLSALLGAGGLRELAKSVTLACVGPTTADALREAGIDPALIADEQSDRGLVEALAKHYGEDPDAVS